MAKKTPQRGFRSDHGRPRNCDAGWWAFYNLRRGRFGSLLDIFRIVIPFPKPGDRAALDRECGGGGPAFALEDPCRKFGRAPGIDAFFRDPASVGELHIAQAHRTAFGCCPFPVTWTEQSRPYAVQAVPEVGVG